MAFFEGNFKCSGICTSALFYWTISTDMGPPTETCIGYLKQAIGDDLGPLGIAALVAAICLFVVWMGQYCLWKKYK